MFLPHNGTGSTVRLIVKGFGLSFIFSSFDNSSYCFHHQPLANRLLPESACHDSYATDHRSTAHRYVSFVVAFESGADLEPHKHNGHPRSDPPLVRSRLTTQRQRHDPTSTRAYSEALFLV